MTVDQLLAAGVLLPLAGFVFNRLIGPSRRTSVVILGPATVGLAFAAFLSAAIMNGTAAGGHHLYDWLTPAGSGAGSLPGLDVLMWLDPLSAVMTMVITGVGFLILVYSTGYMAEEDNAGLSRFFGHMDLFVFSMLVLVLSHNFVLLTIGWAMVGLSSYLLIGFWHERPAAVLAARKAFVMNVVGDVGIVIASFFAFEASGSLDFGALLNPGAAATIAPAVLESIAFALLVGAVAKSAQVPLHTWLPDAMEGPTPTSALIHAATMVTAGVYLIARFEPVFQRSPYAMGTAAVIGAGTALMAALVAGVQTDIKRVLAYSTMSQVGYMIFAVAIGAQVAGIFHLVTHAFFKALLFLAAGNVIHALHGEQDLRRMGGLRKRMPVTAFVFLVGALALCGLPPLSGFFSKDEIIAAGLAAGPLDPLGGLVLLATAGLTAYYMLRTFYLAFMGAERGAVETAHEPGPSMVGPVLVLGFLAAAAGFIQPGPWHLLGDYLGPNFVHLEDSNPLGGALGTALLSLAMVLVGIISASLYFGGRNARRPTRDPAGGRDPLRRAFYWDELQQIAVVRPALYAATAANRVFERFAFDGGIDRLAAALARAGDAVRGVQTGYLRSYALLFAAAGTVVLLAAGIGLR